MSSLREVKDRIASVRSTLKITSAMKLVASSKLRKAQRSIEALRPYEESLRSILAAVLSAVHEPSDAVPASPANGYAVPDEGDIPGDKKKSTVVLAFASNSSMCGAFNANVIKKTLAVLAGIEGPVELWAFGKKVAEGLRKAGVTASRDFMQLIAHPDFEKVAEVASGLRELRDDGGVGDVILVYNRFISTGRQEVVAELWGASAPCGVSAEAGRFSGDRLRPRSVSGRGPQALPVGGMSPEGAKSSGEPFGEAETPEDALFILEPSRESLLESLKPQVEALQLYAALLDSVASEHAARMVAMQAATDNGETLLAELTLEYNKGRQQKITSEILDLVSGAGN